jgi:4-hydroxy-2-oxoheptanedioate aldolase
MHANLVAAIDKVLQAANSAGKKAGIFCTSGQQGKVFADKGFHMISVATDIYVLAGGVSAAINLAKAKESSAKQQGYGS